MNKKLIAAAVSAAIMAPVAAQADVTLYGRVHNGIKIKSVEGGLNTTDVLTLASRFGIKGSSDLGNGLTASARYEYATTTDIGAPIGNLRVGTVGLSGGFGSVTVGNQSGAFYNAVSAIDPTYTVGNALYSSFAGGTYRTSNTIQYTNSFGPVSLQLDVRVNDSDKEGKKKTINDGIAFGLSFAATDNLTFAVAIDSQSTDAVDPVVAVAAVDYVAEVRNSAGVITTAGVTGVARVIGTSGTPSIDTDRTGITAKYTGGGFWAALGWYEQEIGDASIDHTQLWVGTSFGDNTAAMIGFGKADNGETGNKKLKPGQVTVGVYHNMGGGFHLMYEAASYDTDVAGDVGDSTTHILGMRLHF